MEMENRFNRIWYGSESPPWWMLLLASLFRALVALRRCLYRSGLLRRVRVSVPVIVVGNIAVGGTGKTPLTIHLVERLQRAGFTPGVISRGYGGKAHKVPLPVTRSTSPADAGDEPVLIARRAGVPVVVHPRRVLAARTLLHANPAVDVLVCDDGLQHYTLARDVELVVIDAARGLGNTRMLPAGPLREPGHRMRSADYVVVNGAGSPGLPDDVPVVQMSLQPTALVNLRSGERQPADALADGACVAVAGIGNPQRFFSLLAELGYDAECRAFPDHHVFTPDDLAFSGKRPVLMTEKDAVKCAPFAAPDWWYLEISATLNDESFFSRLTEKLALTARHHGNTE